MHKRGEEESAGWVEWLETSVRVIYDSGIAERVKMKVYNMAVRLAVKYGLEMMLLTKNSYSFTTRKVMLQRSLNTIICTVK